jgi:hypothetical protein
MSLGQLTLAEFKETRSGQGEEGSGIAVLQ